MNTLKYIVAFILGVILFILIVELTDYQETQDSSPTTTTIDQDIETTTTTWKE